MKAITIVIFLIFSTISISARNPINFNKDFMIKLGCCHAVAYNFDSIGKVTFKNLGDITSYERVGRYQILNDSIFIQYDTLTQFQKEHLFRGAEPRMKDTIVILNNNKIKSVRYNRNAYSSKHKIYSFDFSNQTLSFKVQNFDDVVYLQQYHLYSWRDIANWQNNSNDTIEIDKYKPELHNGTNKFRLIVSGISQPEVLKRFESKSTFKKSRLVSKKIKDSIHFSNVAKFELANDDWKVLKTGFGKTIDCSDLVPGYYYLIIEDKTIKIKKL